MNRGQRDVYRLDPGDASARQEEILECVELLKKFKPTKIAVEYDKVREDLLQAAYRKYRNGDKPLENDEIEQIGFRLAKALNHSTIYAVDWNRPVGGIPISFIYDFAKDTQPAFFGEMVESGNAWHQRNQEIFKQSTVREYLLYLNSKSQVLDDHRTYIKYFARVAEDDYYVGIDWLANYWYRRNLIIYTNITRLIETKDERLLVIYGRGHKYLLDQFLKESGLFQVEKVEDYLGTI